MHVNARTPAAIRREARAPEHSQVRLRGETRRKRVDSRIVRRIIRPVVAGKPARCVKHSITLVGVANQHLWGERDWACAHSSSSSEGAVASSTASRFSPAAPSLHLPSLCE
eukprot:3474800-Prymnesium_polylepis.1